MSAATHLPLALLLLLAWACALAEATTHSPTLANSTAPPTPKPTGVGTNDSNTILASVFGAIGGVLFIVGLTWCVIKRRK